MEFKDSQTMINLARAFAGESQARNRYTMYAYQARKEGNEYIARLFEETADNEFAHAKEFFNLIILHGGNMDNIDIDAGYPFSIGTTTENLGFAADGENQEHVDAYPAFAECAKQEGFMDVYEKFTMIAEIEGLHHRVFTDAENQLMLAAVADGILFEGGLMGAARAGLLKDVDSMLRYAAACEAASVEKYRAFAETAGDDAKAALLSIAGEEERHLAELTEQTEG